jgi:hypothetical protein
LQEVAVTVEINGIVLIFPRAFEVADKFSSLRQVPMINVEDRIAWRVSFLDMIYFTLWWHVVRRVVAEGIAFKLKLALNDRD